MPLRGVCNFEEDMNKRLIFTGLLAAAFFVGFAQKPYKVVFYNLENFFDTVDDPRVQDDEFTPNGSKKWDTERYAHKLSNVEHVFSDIAALDADFPAVIGVAEVENRGVVEDIATAEKLALADYRIVHFDSPDERGIDVAFLYRADCFCFEGCRPVHTEVPQLPHFKTRDILTMWGTIDCEPFFFVVSHWPSRLGGQEASEFKRMAVGRQIRSIADSVLKNNPATKIVVMGDFNDDPIDKSLVEGLETRMTMNELHAGEFFNPFAAMFRAGSGTLAYNRAWNLFDDIVVTENLATGSVGELKLLQDAGTEFRGHIFKPDYLLQSEGESRGYPLRTFVGKHYQGGFSDHLPVYISIGK